MRRHLVRALRVGAGLVGAAFLVAAFAETWDRSEGLPLPGVPALVAALALVTAGLLVALPSWAVLLDRMPAAPLARGFYAAQLGKYVPGAIWQAVGQVEAAWRLGVPMGRAASAFGVWSLTQAAAGGVLGALAVFAPVPLVVRVGALAAAGLLLLLDRRWMVWALQRLKRSTESVPGTAEIRTAALLGLAPQLAGGLAFTVLLAGVGGGVVPAAVPVAALAWTAGFLAVPFPSGIGVREAVLLAALGPIVDPALLVAASLFQRLVTIVAEGLLVLASRLLPVPAAVRGEGAASRQAAPQETAPQQG